MAIPEALITALAKALQSHAPAGLAKSPTEQDDEYVRRVIPAINGELRQGVKLTPLQTGLYGIPKNALVDIAKTLSFDDDELKKFSKLDRSEMVTQLSHLKGDTETDVEFVFNNHIYAAQASVQQYSFENAPSNKAIKTYLKSGLGRDPFKGEQPKAVGSVYEITNAVDLTDEIYCITLSRAVEEKEAVGNDFRLTTLTGLRHVYLIVEWKKKTIEYRGLASQGEKVIKVLIDLLKGQKIATSYKRFDFDAIVAGELAVELKATAKKVKHVNESSSEEGLRTILTTVDPEWEDENGRNDLFSSVPYKKLKESLGDDFLEEGWDLRFQHDGAFFTVHIHLVSGSLRFPEGKVTDQVIRYVMKNLEKVRETLAARLAAQVKAAGKP